MSLRFSGLKKRLHAHSKMPRNTYWLRGWSSYYTRGNRIYITKMVDGGFVAVDDRISDGNRLDLIKNMVEFRQRFLFAT